MRRFLSFGLVFVLIFSGLVIVLPIGNVSATDPDNTWIADTPQSASNAAYWENGTLTTGQNIWFVDAHDGNCAWDVGDSFGNFMVKAGHSGTITPSINFTVSGNMTPCITGSTFIAGTYTYTVGGNWDSSIGTFNRGTSKVSLIGTGNLKAANAVAGDFYDLDIAYPAQTTTLTNHVDILHNLNLNGGTLATGAYIVVLYSGIAYSITGTGTIGASSFQSGYFTVSIQGSAGSVSFRNDVSIPGLRVMPTGAGTFSVTQSGSVTLTNYLYFDPVTSGRTIQIITSDYALTTLNLLMLGTGGGVSKLDAGSSTIVCAGNWDSSQGTFTPGTSSIHLTGASKTLKTAGTGFNNLMVETGASIQLLSNVKTNHFWNNGSLDLNGFTLTVNNDQAPVFTSTPITSISFDQDYSYDADATDQEGETLTYGIVSDLPSLVINSTTGVVSKSHYLGNGTYYANVSVTDGNHTVYQNYSLELTNQYPVVTSYPRLTLVQGESYFYLVNATDPDGLTVTVNISSNAPWLTINPNGSVQGTPLPQDIGTWLVSVSVWDGYRTTYANYTIEVTALSVETMAILTVLLALAFCSILLVLGIKMWMFWLLAGPCWIIMGIAIFIDYGEAFMLMSVGLGLTLLFMGAYDAFKR